MKQSLLTILLAALLAACSGGEEGGTVRAVYHWKTTYNPTQYELQWLRDHRVTRLYLRVFDVDIYEEEDIAPIANGVPTFGRGGEEALVRVQKEGGDFFRQYALVADGEVLPLKPKGKNHRRALCRLGHQIFVAASGDRESYHDFATALADLGVKDAIALVGSESLLIYRADGGLVHSVGAAIDSPNANFLVWRR